VSAGRSLLVALALALPASRAARAEPADPVAAQALFEQGREQMARGEYEAACPKLEESQRLSPAPGTAFNLADCWTHTGRLASAWSLFRDVEAEARLARQTMRAQVARRRGDELEHLLPRLLIHVPTPPDGIELRRDGVLVGRAQWDTAVPVDLGPHNVAAAAPGRSPWRTTVQVVARAATVTVVVPPLEIVAPEGAAPPPPPPALRLDTPPASRPAQSRTAAIAVGASGLVLLAASGVTIAVAKSRYDSATCSGTVCSSEAALRQRDHARSLGDVATGLAIAGGASVAGGVVLWLATGRRSGGAPEGRVAWNVGIAPSGAVVRATW
jgi:hypothetical protein